MSRAKHSLLCFCLSFLLVLDANFAAPGGIVNYGGTAFAHVEDDGHHSGEITLESVSDAPDPFSAAAAGSVTFQSQFNVQKADGLGDEEEQGRKKRFFIEQTLRITDAATGTEQVALKGETEVLPGSHPDGQDEDDGDDDEDPVISVSVQQPWDGRDALGAIVPDGIYDYEVQGTLLRVKNTTPDGDEDDEKIKVIDISNVLTGEIAVDNTVPVISSVTPADGSTTADSRPVLSAAYSDNLSGIDINSVVLKLDGTDVTSQAAVTASSINFTPGSNLSEQTHLVEIQVKDNAGNTATAVSTFTVLAANAPPVLASVGDQSIPLGTSLNIQLTAGDPDNDPLTFSVSPLPLPSGAAFNAATGLFSFKPAADQVGTFPLTFTVSDGDLTDSETISIFVEEPPVGSVTALSGRVLDTNSFVGGLEVPVTGAVISLLGTGFSAVTDAAGRFTLIGIPGGKQIFDINPAGAPPAPDGSSYAGFREEIHLIDGVNNIIDRPFFIPRIAQESLTTVDPSTTTMVTNPALGITLEVPAHTAKNPDGTDFTGQLSISEVLEGLAPAAMPAALNPGLLITIQPVGVSFAAPAAITFPNIDNLAPGSDVDIWSLDPEAGMFVVVGVGRVSADGSVIETISGGVRAADWHFVMPPVGTPDGSGNNAGHQSPNLSCNSQTGSQTTLCSGNLIEDHAPAGYRSLGQSRAWRLVYNSLSADPQPIISANTTIPVRSAVPPTVSTRLSVAGVDQGFEVFTDTGGLSENANETLRQVVQFDAGSLPTGRYPYQLTLSNNYLLSSVSSRLNGHVLVNNQKSSPLGAGWTLAGLERLSLDENGNAVIADGDGSILFFQLQNLANGLVASWSFDDGSDPTEDTIGGHAGDIVGAMFTATDIAPLTPNVSALAFDGVDDFVRVANSPLLNPTDGITVSAWINRTSPVGSFDPVVKKAGLGGPSQINGYALEFNANNIIFWVHLDGLGWRRSAEGFVPLGAWTHLAGVYDQSGIRVYVNGQAIGSPSLVSGDIGQSSNELNIARDPSNPARLFRGVVDEVKLYGRGLAAGEISVLAGLTAPSEPAYVSPSGDFSTLAKNADGTLTRTFKDGTKINFDAQGLQTSTVDRNGNTTSYSYDAQGRLTAITDPAGLITTLTYGADGLLDRIADPAGRAAVFDHDLNGNLVRIADPDGSQRIFSYDSRHRLIEQTDKRGNISTYNYNFAGRNIKATRADGSTRQVTPCQTVGLVDLSSGTGTASNPAPVVRPSAAVSTFTDGNGNVTTLTTDSFGAATTPTDALGRTTSIVRDSDANPTQITQPNGAVTVMTYDARGNLLATTDQSISATTTFTYEPAFNQVTSINDPELNTTTINYDTNGNPVTIKDALNNQTTLSYNAQGLLIQVTGALGNATQFTYNAAGNLAMTTDPLNHTTTLDYDPAGNVIRSTDAQGSVTNFTYDTMNRLIRVVDAIGGTTNYEYDAVGNLTKVTDARNNSTTFEYDSQNRLVKTIDPLGKFETFSYDANGNLRQIIDRRLSTINFQYDAVNQLIRKTLPGNLTTSFIYDTVGNLTSTIDPDSALGFTYDGAGRLISATDNHTLSPNPLTLTYTYDKNGNRLTMTNSVTGTTNYTYDALNRLSILDPPSSSPINFSYDALSRRTSTTLPNGTTTNYSYDAASQLLSLSHQLSAVPFTSFGYTYDQIGNRTSKTQDGTTSNYAYDSLSRLISATNPAENFAYDPVGNRNPLTQVYNNANRLLDDGTFTYTYDNNGNTTSKTNKATLETTTYAYDTENQLIRVQSPTTSAQYRYDGLGRRIEKNVNGTITRYVYDNEDILLEYNGANTLQARYTHGAGIDEPLVMERSGQSYFYHADGLGSITDLTDSTGAIAQSYVYDSFGNIVLQNGTITNSYTYTGREFDSESGLYYYRARYYDPTIGRFLQEDPIGMTIDTINLYFYVQNNPINRIDSHGLRGEKEIKQLLDQEFGNRLTESEKQKIADFTGKQISVGLGFKLLNKDPKVQTEALKELEQKVRKAIENADEDTKNIFEKLEKLQDDPRGSTCPPEK